MGGDDKNRLYTQDDLQKDSKDVSKRRTSYVFGSLSSSTGTVLGDVGSAPVQPAVQASTQNLIGLPINDTYGTIGNITQIIPLNVYGSGYSIIKLSGDTILAFDGLPAGRHIGFTIDITVVKPTGAPPTLAFDPRLDNPPTLPSLVNGTHLVLQFRGAVYGDIMTPVTVYTYIGGTISGGATVGGLARDLANLESPTVPGVNISMNKHNITDVGTLEFTIQPTAGLSNHLVGMGYETGTSLNRLVYSVASAANIHEWRSAGVVLATLARSTSAGVDGVLHIDDVRTSHILLGGVLSMGVGTQLSPAPGQLWYDTTDNMFKARQGSTTYDFVGAATGGLATDLSNLADPTVPNVAIAMNKKGVTGVGTLEFTIQPTAGLSNHLVGMGYETGTSLNRLVYSVASAANIHEWRSAGVVLATLARSTSAGVDGVLHIDDVRTSHILLGGVLSMGVGTQLSPAPGQIWYDTTDNMFKARQGSTTYDFVGSGATALATDLSNLAATTVPPHDLKMNNHDLLEVGNLDFDATTSEIKGLVTLSWWQTDQNIKSLPAGIVYTVAASDTHSFIINTTEIMSVGTATINMLQSVAMNNHVISNLNRINFNTSDVTVATQTGIGYESGGGGNMIYGVASTSAGHKWRINTLEVAELTRHSSLGGQLHVYQLATSSIVLGGVLVMGSSRPSSPLNGFMWYNTSTAKFECRQDGTTYDFVGSGVTGANIELSNLGTTALNANINMRSNSITFHTANIVKISGSALGLLYNVPTGDFHFWQVNNTTVAYLDDAAFTLSAGTSLIIDSNYAQFREISTPLRPSSTLGRMYAKDVGGVTTPFWYDSVGNETSMIGSSAAGANIQLSNLGTTVVNADINMRGNSITFKTSDIVKIVGSSSGLAYQVPENFSHIWQVNNSIRARIQTSGFTLSTNTSLLINRNYAQFREINQPLRPPANYGIMYAKDVNGVTTPFWYDNANNDTSMIGGGGSTFDPSAITQNLLPKVDKGINIGSGSKRIDVIDVFDMFVDNDLDVTENLSVGEDATIGEELNVGGELDINGNLNHDGDKVGFYGATPASQATIPNLPLNSSLQTTVGRVQQIIQTLRTIGITS